MSNTGRRNPDGPGRAPRSLAAPGAIRGARPGEVRAVQPDSSDRPTVHRRRKRASGSPPSRRIGLAVYPEDAKAAGIKGVVQIEIVIDETGKVIDAQVIRSVPLLDAAALTAVREWQFQPAAFNGKPIPIRMTFTVQFTP